MESNKEDITKLYSVPEFAKIMGKSTRTIYNWIKDPDKGIKIVDISGKQFIKLKSA